MDTTLTQNKKANMFTDEDKAFFKKEGFKLEVVESQLNLFEEGVPFVNLANSANIDNGIKKLSPKKLEALINLYDKNDKDVLKFVPASGAASRMFKLLQQFLTAYNPNKESLHGFLKKESFKPLSVFFDNLDSLPFYDKVASQLNINLKSDHYKYEFVKILLEDLGYASLPKGVIPFHKYANHTYTAFEEHLKEAAQYSTKKGKTKLHFTVSKDHLPQFKQVFELAAGKGKVNTENIEVTYSFQHQSTNTIAVTPDNKPFRKEDGNILFRPGGHGALIENLNQVEADIVFIKNIDNVVTHDRLNTLANYKKALAGMLIELQNEVFALLEEVETNNFDKTIKEKAEKLVRNKFDLILSFDNNKQIKKFFNRPIRVCGMVENKGEPGGGPYWVENEKGHKSLQIVESAQINQHDENQQEILRKSTHFNPVDLVCGIKNYRGEKFDLTEFVNSEQSFISKKSKNGKKLKALELPGLWNGAMAKWNTIFVEVPLETFNPVKTVLDLLKPGHQADH